MKDTRVTIILAAGFLVSVAQAFVGALTLLMLLTGWSAEINAIGFGLWLWLVGTLTALATGAGLVRHITG